MAKATNTKGSWTDYTKREATIGEDTLDTQLKGDEALLEQIVRNQLQQIDSLNEINKQQAAEINRLNNEMKNTPQTTLERLADSMTQALDFDEVADRLDIVQDNWNTLFYATNQPMSVAKDGHFTNVNRSLRSALGYNEDDMLGHVVTEFIAEKDLPKAIRIAENSMSGQPITDNVIHLVCKNQELVKVKIDVKPFGLNCKDNAPYTIAFFEFLD